MNIKSTMGVHTRTPATRIANKNQLPVVKPAGGSKDGFRLSEVEPIATTATTLIGAGLGAAGGIGVAALGGVGLTTAIATTAVAAGAATYLLSLTIDDKETALQTAIAGGLMAGLATASAGGLSGLTSQPLLSGTLLGAGGGLALGAFATGS